MVDAAQAIRRAPERRENQRQQVVGGVLNTGGHEWTNAINTSDNVGAYRFTVSNAPVATSYTAATLR